LGVPKRHFAHLPAEAFASGAPEWAAVVGFSGARSARSKSAWGMFASAWNLCGVWRLMP